MVISNRSNSTMSGVANDICSSLLSDPAPRICVVTSSPEDLEAAQSTDRRLRRAHVQLCSTITAPIVQLSSARMNHVSPRTSRWPLSYTSPVPPGKRLRRWAAVAACKRFDTPSFAMMWETWTLTVLSVMNNRLAICWFE